MKIETVETPGAEWDEFALSQPGAMLGHAAAWAGVLARGYRLETRWLAARRAGGEVSGVLPLAFVPGLRGGRELVSLPYLDTAGVLAAEPEAAEALLEAALALARRRGASALLIRSLAGDGESPSPPDRVDLVLELAADVEAQWNAVRAKVRNQTRKAEKEGLSLIERDGAEQTDAFYEPFAINMRDLGSPVHARRFFAEVAAAFGDSARFVVTGLGDRPVGGLVAIHYGDTVTIPWASTLRSERRRCPNNQIYWEALRWSVERGAARVDFGRSPRDGGTHRFKTGWGATPRELAWRRLAPDGTALALAAPGSSGLLAGLSRVWTRLPVALATKLGPPIRRRISS